jgi:multidrug efflux pump subunit AcrA (membrane-fusion protein)
MTLNRALLLLVLLMVAGTSAAQGIRDRIRIRDRGTVVSDAQAEALTLTLAPVTPRSIQTWIRVAGEIGSGGRSLTATVSRADAALVEAGQRVRAFPPSSKSSMYQARVTRVTRKPDGDAVVEAALIAPPRQNTPLYVMEIVIERPYLLSVPNEAIIEEGDHRVVYVQQEGGQYLPQEVRTGIQGELYTEILDGVKDGDQVVTFGSFFIDAEHKLKGTDQGVPPEGAGSQ